MDEAEDRCSTDPAPPADGPLEMRTEEANRMIGWQLYLRRGFLYHHRRMEMGADKRDVAIALLSELLRFAGRDRVLRPLLPPVSELAFALEDGTPGSLAPYLKPPAVAAEDASIGGRPPLDSTKRLRGVVAYLVETLITGHAFSATKAAEEVAATLNTEGCLMPGGQRFKDFTITDWHERVIHSDDRSDLEYQVYNSQKLGLKQRHPEHAGWGPPQLKLWLTETVRQLARGGLGRKPKKRDRQKKVVKRGALSRNP